MTPVDDDLKTLVQMLMAQDLAYPIYNDGLTCVEPNLQFIVCLDYAKYIEKTGHKIEYSKTIVYSHPAYKKRDRSDLVLWIPYESAVQTTWEIVTGPKVIESCQSRSLKLLPEYTYNAEYIYMQYKKNEGGLHRDPV